MAALTLLAILVRGLTAFPAPAVERSPVAVLLRSETPSLGARRLRVLVRVDSQAAARRIRVADVIESVREIWRPYAEIDFEDAGNAPGAAYDDEVHLVMTDRARPPDSANAAALGWIEFIDGQPRNTITVSLAAAQAMMRRDTWLGREIGTLPPSVQQRFITRAVSRSSAHEIGHYLLRSRAHATRGLMRAHMTVNEIMDDAPALCRLLPSETAWLDRRLAEAPASDPRNPLVPLRERKS